MTQYGGVHCEGGGEGHSTARVVFRDRGRWELWRCAGQKGIVCAMVFGVRSGLEAGMPLSACAVVGYGETTAGGLLCLLVV